MSIGASIIIFPTIEAMKSMGERIRDLRKARKLSQKALCEVAGIKQSSLSDIETGETSAQELKALTLLGLAKGLRADPEFLLTGKGDPLQYQLVWFYGKLSANGKDTLLGNANRIYSQEYPNDRQADPFSDNGSKPVRQKAK